MIDFLKKLIFARFRSLKVSMLYALLVGIVLAISSFILINMVSDAYITERYLSSESRDERESSYYRELQRFVDRHGLESSDTDVLSEWVRDNRYLYVMIYKDDQLLLDSDSAEKNPDHPTEDGDTDADKPQDGGDAAGDGEEDKDDDQSGSQSGGSGITVTFPTREDLIAYAQSKGTYPIEMADGVPLLVSLVDYTEYFYYDFFNIVSLFFSAIVLIIVIMIYFNSITRRITRLDREVSQVASGDIAYSLAKDASSGRDEISSLARNVENMRCTMLDSIEKEHRAMESNTELITSMSHDIRTPLTVLLGYIDLMKMHTEDDKLGEYLAASESTALRLKQMSDDMFGYFLVFGQEGEDADIEEYDLVTLFEQIMSEKVLLLREQGYTVDVSSLDSFSERAGSVTVLTDAPKLMRISENIFSNITKYADKSSPVVISSDIGDGELTVRIVNRISDMRDGAESNGIGLRTCRKLAEIIGMRFSAEECCGEFTVLLTIPLGGGSK